MLGDVTRTWADISLAAIAANFRALSADDSEIMTVVKADGYGHGMVAVARACVAAGARHFGVATLDEGLALRQAGISQEIYALSPLLPDEAERAIRANVVPFVSSTNFFVAFAEAARNAPLPARAVLTVDTGMGREGMLLPEAISLPKLPNVELIGLSTHLASADEDDPEPTRSQLEAFDEALSILDPDGKLWISWANSPGMLKHRDRKGIHRTGAALYGIEPYPGAFDGSTLKPVLEWKARVTLVREFPVGATIGYGRTATLSRPSRIATVAVGYGDGLHRGLSNTGEVLLAGKRCPMVGRVSMDQIQVDVTDIPEVTQGAAATLIGQDGSESITAADMAERAGTTCHAPTTMLTRRVKRQYF